MSESSSSSVFPSTTQSLTPKALQSDAVLRAAFIAWFPTTSYVGDPVLMCEKSYVNAKVWQQFLHAQALASNGSTPQPTPPPAVKSQPIPTPLPPPAVVSTPTRVPQPTPPPTTPAASSNPLIALIADGLRDMGFSPERSVTAEHAQALAEDAALSMAETVLAQLRADLESGKYRSTQRVEIVLNGKAVREIEGKAPVWFARLLKLCQCRVPALLVGPAGCGKTTSAEMVAKALGLPFYRLSMAAGVDEGSLQGWLLPKQQMNFEYVASMCSHAYEHGGVVLIDDMDLSDANMLGIANAVLDDGDWFIALRHGQPMFTRHPDFIVIAAANTWGHGATRQHNAANQLDERTLSRFRIGQVPCDYDAELETDRFPEDVVSFGHMLRNRVRAIPGQHRDVSTRDMAQVTKLRQAMSLEESWYGYFADWADEECRHVHAHVNHSAMTATLN